MGALQGYKRIAKGESTIDFAGRWKTWLVVSGVLVVISIAGLFIRELNLGLAFEGGSAFAVPVAESKNPTVPEVQDALKALDLGEAQVQIARGSNGRNIRVETKEVANLPPVVSKLAEIAGTSPEQVSVQAVGPTWGNQISSKALRALIVFLILVVIYISFRFEPKMAICAIVALIHDVAITVGIYAVVGFEVSPATVVAYLTILGYSLYDSVVVFDKVRENQNMVGGTSRFTYSDMVNKSVNQTLMRSINTSLSSLLPVGALLFVGVYLFGAETLKDLALALFIGIAVGSYSSIFVGPPLLAVLKEREPRFKQIKARARTLQPAAAGAGAGAMTVPSTPSAGSAASSGEATPRPEPRRPSGGPSSMQPRGRKKTRKKRRR